MPSIPTFTGIKFDLTRPRPEFVCTDDIVFALSNTPRFTGHVEYSVAQHSVMVADLVDPSIELYGLLHDAAEAYTGDISAPLKELLGNRFRKIERRIDAAIAARFGLEWTPDIKREVKAADEIALATERRDLFRSPPGWWNWHTANPREQTIRHKWSAAGARRTFGDRLRDLLDRRSAG